MTRRFNLLFYLKKPKKYEKGGLMPVYMRVSVGGKRTEFATQRITVFLRSYSGMPLKYAREVILLWHSRAQDNFATIEFTG